MCVEHCIEGRTFSSTSVLAVGIDVSHDSGLIWFLNRDGLPLVYSLAID